MSRRASGLTLLCLALAVCTSTSDGDFEVIAQLDVGRNPHQISFSEDGRTAYVATAGEDRITVIDAVRYEIVGTIPVPGTPLGVIPLPNGKDLAVARFDAGGVARYARNGGALGGDRGTSAGASLITGPYAGDRYLVSVEAADSVHVFDARAFTFVASYPTGDRPFPAAATSDGRLAFVPGYSDGTVTVIDLFNDRVLETVSVGDRPSGGAVLPGDIEYAVVVRGENRVAFISTASHDVSVIDLADRRVIRRIPVPDIPIVMSVHPSGGELWVSSEVVHRLTVISIPEVWRDDPRDLPATAVLGSQVTEVAVMGMIHSGHPT